VPVDPGSYRHGRPDGGRRRKPKPGERPLAAAVDRWLADGGWGAGWPGAGSVALDDGPDARSRVHNLWQYEKRVRGWTGADVASHVVTDAAGTARFYWLAPPGPVESGGAATVAVPDVSRPAGKGACGFSEADPFVAFVLARIGEEEERGRNPGHYHCDDCWYSCPKAVESCGSARTGSDECDCDAEKRGAEILARVAALRSLVASMALAANDGDLNVNYAGARALRHVAAIWAWHPDCRPEWAADA
jgi:hypothetical protein